MTKLFNFQLSTHSLTAGFKMLNIRHSIGLMCFGVSCACAVEVLACAFFEVVGISCVVAAVAALQDVNVKYHPFNRPQAALSSRV